MVLFRACNLRVFQMTPRRYQLGKRAQTTAANRAKVTAAARELFGSVGFQQVSMEAVAKKAGVGRTTVFEQFRSKTALFLAVAEELRQQAYALQFELAGAPTLEARLDAALKGAAELWAAELGLYRRLDGLEILEAEGGVAAIRDEERRRERVRALAGELVGSGRARAGVDEAEVADVLGVLTSFPTFAQLARTRGSTGAAKAALDRMVSSLLVPAPSP